MNRTGSRGFTLVEVLVALVVLGLCILPMLRIFSAGFRGLGDAEAYRKAALWAESQLEAVGASGPLAPSESTGHLPDGFRYAVSVVAEPLSDREGTAALPVLTYRVTVAVSWPGWTGARSVTLTTRRLQPVAPASP
jgi:prepilin-type N-terminal cleavage/methylation domain-containing protein